MTLSELDKELSEHESTTDSIEIPLQLLRECEDHKPTLFVYAWLQVNENAGIESSVAAVAEQCGIEEDDAQTRINWLKAYGWIEQIEQRGVNGIYRAIRDLAERK